MADQIRTRGSTRLRKADLAGNKYRGSATSAAFTPVKAASSETKHKQRKEQLSTELQAQSRELSREQTASSLLLKLRQGAQSGKLKSLQLQESNALKLDQTQELGQFNIDKSVALANASLKTAGIKAQGDVASANFKTISSIAQMSVKFAATWQSTVQEAKQQEQTSLEMFGLSREDLDAVDKGNQDNESFNASIVANQKSAEKVSEGDQGLEQTITSDASEAVLYKQARQLTINEKAATISPYVHAFMASGEVIEETPWGPLAPNQASGVEQITYMNRLAIQRWGVENNIAAMIKGDAAQVFKVLVPQVKAAQSQVLNGIIQQDIAGRIKEAKANALVAAHSDLDAGVDAAEVVQNLYAANVASGGYRGNTAGASDDAVKDVLAYAVKTRNEDIIDQLEEGYKIKGNKGLQWKKIKAAEILKARRDLAAGEIQDGNTHLAKQKTKVLGVLETRLKALDKDDITNAEEVEINKDAIQKLKSIGGKYALDEAKKLSDRGLNYNPWYFQELKAAQIDPDNPVEYTNEELHDWYVNQDITLKEAKELGYEPIKGRSSDSVAKAKLKDWNIDTTSVGKGIVLSVLADTIADKDERSYIAKTQGSNIANDITRRLNSDMYIWLRQNPKATPSDAAKYLSDLTEQYVKRLTPSIKYDSNTGLISGYEYGGQTPMDWKMPDQPLIRPNGTKYYNYSTQPIEQLKDPKFGGIAVFNPTKHQILTEQELDLGWRAINGEEGIGIPRAVSEKADALGISITDLIIMQAQFHPEYPGASNLPVGDPLRQLQPPPEEPKVDTMAHALTQPSLI